MNRRETLKALMAASGSLIALPAWAEGWKASALPEYSSVFSPEAQDTLSAVADTIIPAGDSVGALSVEVDKFLQKLFADCYEKEVQDNINTQLTALDSSAKNLHSRPFKECDQAQREALLLKLEQSAVEAEAEFFGLVKSETIRGFRTSREVLLNYLNYKQVPGHFYGCVDVNA